MQAPLYPVGTEAGGLGALGIWIQNPESSRSSGAEELDRKTGDCVARPGAAVTSSVMFSLRDHYPELVIMHRTRVPTLLCPALQARHRGCMCQASLGSHVPALDASHHVPPSSLPSWEPE